MRRLGLRLIGVLAVCAASAGCKHSQNFWPYQRSALGAPQITPSALILYPGDLDLFFRCPSMRLGDLGFDEPARGFVSREAAKYGGTHVVLVDSTMQRAGSTTSVASTGSLTVATTRDNYDGVWVWRVYRVAPRDMGCLPRTLQIRPE